MIIIKRQQTIVLQRIWAIGLMESCFCISDNLLRLFATARVVNPKIGFNLVLKPLLSLNIALKIKFQIKVPNYSELYYICTRNSFNGNCW